MAQDSSGLVPLSSVTRRGTSLEFGAIILENDELHGSCNGGVSEASHALILASGDIQLAMLRSGDHVTRQSFHVKSASQSVELGGESFLSSWDAA